MEKIKITEHMGGIYKEMKYKNRHLAIFKGANREQWVVYLDQTLVSKMRFEKENDAFKFLKGRVNG